MRAKAILFALIGCLSGLILLNQACKKEEEKTNEAPTCKITYPSTGENFLKGVTVPVAVDATDPDGSIAKVTFYVDGEERSTASSSPYKWGWDTSNETLGSHTLKATSTDNEEASASDEVTVTVYEQVAPEAVFSGFPTCGVAPCTVDFTDLSTSGPTSWQWDFGDGNTSTSQNPSHTYDADGAYTVTLIVTNDQGSGTETRTAYINISPDGCFEVFQDPRDGQEYKTVTIGEQTWFAENLNYETGTSWCYDENPNNCATYGRLYDWETAVDACPAGWHLSDDDEWKLLEGMVDSQYPVGDPEWDGSGYRGSDAGTNLKSSGDWIEGNGTDLFGFTGLPGGTRDTDGVFDWAGSIGGWWASSEMASDEAWTRSLNHFGPEVHRGQFDIRMGLSVRCVRDN